MDPPTFGTCGSICAMYGCSNYRVQKDAKSFFSFPKSDIYKEWVHKTKRADLDESVKLRGPDCLKYLKVCEIHFKDDDFRNPRNKSQGLKKGVVPSLHVYNGSTKVDSRRSPKKRPRLDTSSPSRCSNRTNTLPQNCENSGPLPDARLPKRNSTAIYLQMQAEVRKLKLARSRISKLKKTIQKLKETKELPRTCTDIEDGNCWASVFKDKDSFLFHQLKLKCKKLKARRYTESDKSFALALHYCSPVAYRFLRKTICLPTVRSLRRWLGGIAVCPGFAENILQLLNMKSRHMRTEDKVVSLVMDEMSLKEAVSYHAAGDIIEGIAPWKFDVSSTCTGVESDIPLANQVLVIMMRGIKTNFKQVIGYFFSNGPIPGQILKNILLTAINKVKGAGFIPKVVTTDQGSNNVQYRNLLGITEEKPFLEENGEKVFFFYDVPHLLKSVRNNFKKYVIVAGGKTFKWKHIEEFYHKDKDMYPRLAPKLKNIHITLPPFSSMRVCLAAQVLSHSVSRGILTHVALNSMAPEAAHTREFLEHMDNLFDCFNSSSLSANNIFRKPLQDNSIHWEFLVKASHLLETVHFTGGSREKIRCIRGWKTNICALKLLWNDLSTKFHFKFLLTRRLTQDCLESFFSVMRSKGGNNVTPDASKFRATLRAAMVQQLLTSSPDSNVEMDMETFLLQRKEINDASFKLYIEPQVTLKDCPDHIPFCDEIEMNAVTYLAGWACSQLQHEDCKRKFTKENWSMEIDEIHISMKEYQGCSLLYPSDEAKQVTRIVHGCVKSMLKKIILQSNVGVRSSLMKEIMCRLPSLSVCSVCKTMFVSKLLNASIKCFVKVVNESHIIKAKKKQNMKAKKIMHK